MNIGSGLPVLMRLISSLASSMIVRSAVTSMLNTASGPSLRIAATILPSTLVPTGMSNASPSVALIDGAVKNTTFLDGSESAAHTSPVVVLSDSAPTGHATMHCPQPTHGESTSGLSNALPMWTWKPLPIGPIALTLCLRHAATQRMQLMHLSLSRTTYGVDMSMGKTKSSPLNLSSST